MRKTFEPSRLEEPSEEFCDWWNPSRRDHESGADIGGHPDAERVWARKDPGRWVHRTYGTNARIAWNAQCYRSEYLRWIEIGRPEREDCMMISETVERQKEFWKGLKTLMAEIGKKPPKAQPMDYDPPVMGEPLEY